MRKAILIYILGLVIDTTLQAAVPDSIRIYLHAGGIHSDVILPMKSEICDWSVVLDRPLHESEIEEWLSVGWGNRNFYLNTPTWREAKLKDVLGAMVGRGGSAYHILSMKEPLLDEHCMAFLISADQYRALCDFILTGFEDSKTPKALLGYKPARPWDAFYGAKGVYWLLNNCNSWSNRAMRSAGVSKSFGIVTYKQLFRALKQKAIPKAND